MRPSEIIPTAKLLIRAKQPFMLHGSPGSGKSQVIRQIAQDLEYNMIDLRLSQLDPVDLRGLPYADMTGNLTRWLIASFLPNTERHGTHGILFLDELPSAAQSVMAAAYQLILDRRLGDYVLPEGWTCVAAGNRITDRAIVNQMGTALKNRFVHLNFDVNVDDWCQWALTHGVHTSVLSFIRFRPMLLNEFEARGDSSEERGRQQRMKDSMAFATPRSWEFMSKIMEQGPDPSIEHELYSGCIGEGVAAEFVGFMKYYRDLPNLDSLLMNPKQAPVPEQPATLYALSTGLAMKATEDNMDRLVEYALRMPAEFQVLLMKDASTRDNNLTNTRAFNTWALKNKNVLV